MDVLMVSGELSPYARASDAATSVACLAKALKQLGHRVTLALPRYRGFEAEGLFVARRLTPLVVGEREVTVFDGQLASGVEIVLFDLPGHAERERVHGDDDLDFFSWLGRATAALAERRAEQGKRFDVVHAHDWPGGLVGPFLGEQSPPFVFTLHDADRAGVFDREALQSLSPGAPLGDPPSALALCLFHAQAVTTVSPSYARSLGEPGSLLAEPLARLGDSLLGIEDGIDYAVYNPATDSSLEARYDAEDPWGKARTKGAVLHELGLELDILRPLLVFSGPLDHEHGADLLALALPELEKANLAVIAAGALDDSLREAFDRARERRPESFALVERSEDELRRRLHAAADIAVLPFRRAPTGFAARLAQRYGAVPVLHATGGLADAVVDCDSALETGTGFVFDEPERGLLVGAVERAVAHFASENDWARLRRRVMRLDLGWDRPARRYAQVYRNAGEAQG